MLYLVPTAGPLCLIDVPSTGQASLASICRISCGYLLGKIPVSHQMFVLGWHSLSLAH